MKNFNIEKSLDKLADVMKELTMDTDPNTIDTMFNNGLLTYYLKNDEGIVSSRKPKDTEQADTQNLTKVKDENTWISKGNSFAKIGKHEEAIWCYDEAIKIKPDSASIRYNKGTILARIGKHEEAIWCYDEALRLSPNYIEAFSDKIKSWYLLTGMKMQ